MPLIGSIGVNFSANTTNLISGINMAKNALSSLASNPVGAVGIGLAAVGLTAVAVGAQTVKMAGDWQQSMTLLVNSAGESQDKIKMVGDGLLQMGIDTGTSTEQLAKGMFNVESAGYRGAAGLSVMRAAAMGAKVENSDLAATTDVLTTTMHSYHMPAQQAVNVMNSFRMAASMGKMHMDDLTGALRNVLPIAATAGVKITDVEAALSTMSNAGDKGAAAGTHLSQMLTYLLAPSSKATKVLKEVGLTTQQISDEMKVSLPGTVDMITKAVGEKFPVGSAKYVAAISAIVGGNKSMKAMLEVSGGSFKEFANDAGSLGTTMKGVSTAVDGFSLVQQNLNFKLDQGKAAMQALGIRVGTALLPVFSALADRGVQTITTLGKAFDGMMKYFNGDAFQGFIADVQTVGNQLGRMLGPVMGQLPTFEHVLNGVGTAFAWMIDKVDIVVFGLGQFLLFLNENQTAMNVFKAVLAGIGVVLLGVAVAAIPPLVIAFGAWAVAAGAAAIATLAATWPLLAIGAAVALVVFGIIEAVQHWGQITAWLKGVWGGIGAWFQGVLGAIGNFFTQTWQGTQNKTSQFMSFLGSAVQSGMKAVFDFFMAPINLMGQGMQWLYNHNYYIKLMVDTIVQDVQRLGSFLRTEWNIIVMGVTQAFLYIYNGASMYWSLITSTIQRWSSAAWSFLVGIWNQIVSSLTQAGQRAWAAVVSMWTRISGVFSSAWSTYLSGPLTSAWNSVLNFINSWGSQAYQSGANFVHMLADGITNGIGVIGSAVSGIAKTIWANLGFHSPTKEGYGSTAHTWMPNLINMMASGLLQGQPIIQSAANSVAGKLAPLTGTTSASHIVGTQGASGALHGTSSGAHTLVYSAPSTHHHTAPGTHHHLATTTHHHRASGVHHHASAGTHHHLASGTHHHGGNAVHHHTGAATHHHAPTRGTHHHASAGTHHHLASGAHHHHAAGLHHHHATTTHHHLAPTISTYSAPSTNTYSGTNNNTFTGTNNNRFNTSSGGGNGGKRQETIILEIDGRQFGRAIVNDLGNELVKRIRLESRAA